MMKMSGVCNRMSGFKPSSHRVLNHYSAKTFRATTKNCGKMKLPNMALYLGIDAGGTKTDSAVSNGAELLGQASGGSCKLARGNQQKGRENLQSVIQRASEAARILPRDIQHVCIGLAGALRRGIAQAWNVAREEVVRLATASEPLFAELAAPVTAAAEKGEPAARAITGRAGQALAWLAGAVIRRLWPKGGVVPVALSGGVLQGSALVRQAFKEAIRVEYPEAAVSFAVVRPVLGALEIAAQRGRG